MHHLTDKIAHTTTITGRKEGNVLFNDPLNIFYLRVYGVKAITSLRTLAGSTMTDRSDDPSRQEGGGGGKECLTSVLYCIIEKI